MKKAERHEIYKKALEYINKIRPEGFSYMGICYFLSLENYEINSRNFPELYKYRPKKSIGGKQRSNRNNFWWPMSDKKVRIKYLEMLIEKTK